MTVAQFAEKLVMYCTHFRGSVVGWGCTPVVNAKLGRAPASGHVEWLAADVVYDGRPPQDERESMAEFLGLSLYPRLELDTVAARRRQVHDHGDPVGTIERVVTIIRDVGFPIAVAGFVLWRLDALLRQIRDDQRDVIGLLGGTRRRDQLPPSS